MNFYCDSCGKAVNMNDDLCSNCGASFKGIRCPSCGFNGDSDKFANGCPRCGYQKQIEIISLDPENKKSLKKKGKNTKKAIDDGSEDFIQQDKGFYEKSKPKRTRFNPPREFYQIAIPILTIVLGVLVIILIT